MTLWTSWDTLHENIEDEKTSSTYHSLGADCDSLFFSVTLQGFIALETLQKIQSAIALLDVLNPHIDLLGDDAVAIDESAYFNLPVMNCKSILEEVSISNLTVLVMVCEYNYL